MYELYNILQKHGVHPPSRGGGGLKKGRGVEENLRAGG